MPDSLRVEVHVEIRRATPADLRTLATWSSNVENAFKPALESGRGLLLVASADGRFPIGHLLVSLATAQSDSTGVISHLLVLGGFRGKGIGSALMNEGER